MNTQTVTFTVEALKAPADGKPGAIKTDQGKWITAWEGEFGKFSKGVRYKTVVYNKPYNGKDQWTVSKLDKGGSIEVIGQAPSTGAAHATHSDDSGYEDRKSEAIFVTGVVQQSMATGKFGITDIPVLAKSATQAWRDRANMPKNKTVTEMKNDLDDEIPF